MSFGLDVKRFAEKAKNNARKIADRSTEIAHASIVEGSVLTGSPGQPVDTGALKGSWVIQFGPLVNLISSPLIYAPMIEDGTRAGRALTLRSKVGGFHSLLLTRIAWQKIVAQATAEVGVI